MVKLTSQDVKSLRQLLPRRPVGPSEETQNRASYTFTCSRAKPCEELGMVSRCDSSSGMKLSRRHLKHNRAFEVRGTRGKVE